MVPLTAWRFHFGVDCDAHQHNDGRSHIRTVKPTSSERASAEMTHRAVGIAGGLAGGRTLGSPSRKLRLAFACRFVPVPSDPGFQHRNGVGRQSNHVRLVPWGEAS